jgi:hypothetical protein
MSKHAAFYVAIFTATALFIGYYFAHYRGNAADAITRLQQAAALKRARDRAFGIVVLLCVISAAVVYVLARKHHG